MWTESVYISLLCSHCAFVYSNVLVHSDEHLNGVLFEGVPMFERHVELHSKSDRTL